MRVWPMGTPSLPGLNNRKQEAKERYLSQPSHKKLRKPGVRLRNRRRAIAGWSRYSTRYEAIAYYETIPSRPQTYYTEIAFALRSTCALGCA
ncbi:hypothetical protein LZ554_002150 [Drepanopeziza brunnea f. sp. 'monogermtubi']|nr:hypothetical protein LZ554_002150 [Drepanopeziza brunnea f. sp. 'monogermtubi']